MTMKRGGGGGGGGASLDSTGMCSNKNGETAVHAYLQR